jgi:ferrochelatase
MQTGNHSNLLIVNFGGPRSLSEVPSFLHELLTDHDVIRPAFPHFLHDRFFARVARKRSHKVAEDYELIGGGSPIYDDTQRIASHLNAQATFHRYLVATHEESLASIRSREGNWKVFPLFPQFSYSTTGSSARFLHKKGFDELQWIKSYAGHPAYIAAMQSCVRDFLSSNYLPEEETLLFFSPHGLPLTFTKTGDPYQSECELSYNLIRAAFPKARSVLAYQSKFGRGEWIRPYTIDLCENIHEIAQGAKNVVFIPLSFTSDHIETLFEVEAQYLPPIREQGLRAFRCPALNHRPDWLSAIPQIIATTDTKMSSELIFKR